jgi:ankyrin repeat protein
MLILAINRSAPADVVEMIMDCDDEAADHLSANGESILHVACSNSEATRVLLARHPGKVSVKDHVGQLPLHVATNEVTAQLLIHLFPQGLVERSRKRGWLPLHHALSREQIEPDLLRILGNQDLCPREVNIVLCRDKHGKTPLRMLLERLETSFVDELWHVLQEWIMRLPRSGPHLHAHIELSCCKTKLLMEKALEHFADEIFERDDMGRTPLHIAAINGQCDADAFEVLIRANPKAPRMTDNEGRLPIDLAAESPTAQPHCLALLMKGEPRAFNTRDLMNGYYPFLTSALSPQQNATNTYFLLRARPEVLSYYHTP